MTLIHHRCDSVAKGRHLRASCPISKGDLILVERPLLFLQSLDGKASICRHCGCWLGDADFAMQQRFLDQPNPQHRSIYACSAQCGYLYCSVACRDDHSAVHQHLCTGKCTQDHPLVKFKQYAVETNEILLLAAEWWVAQHVFDNRKATYTDFVMEPWWNVEVLDLQSQVGGFVQAAELQRSLNTICDTAASLLAQCCFSPAPTALDLAMRIGACAQNSMGVRQRNPLCRTVFDRPFREQWHEQIIQALAEADFIGGNDDLVRHQADDSTAKKDDDTSPVVPAVSHDDGNEAHEWDYSVDEIAAFLVTLHIDEDGLVLDEATTATDGPCEGDDLDYLFPPLDGTAMLSNICKMNHSCDPNVIVLYPRGKFQGEPLAAYAVALRDIEPDEELTICYIDKDLSYNERQQALVNYGFACTCNRCESEKAGTTAQSTRVAGDELDDLFGASDNDLGEGETPRETPLEENDLDGASLNEDQTSSDLSPEEQLERMLGRLETSSNHIRYGSVPTPILAPVCAFVIQSVSDILPLINDETVVNILSRCADGCQAKDFCLCQMVGTELVEIFDSWLTKSKPFPSIAYRTAYWCAVLAAAVANSHEGSFLKSLELLDKGVILGMPRSDKRIASFFAYTEEHARDLAVGPYTGAGVQGKIPDYSHMELRTLCQTHGLSQPLSSLVSETEAEPDAVLFRQRYLELQEPIVIRSFACDWTALHAFRDLGFLSSAYGHRLVPIEHGSMLEGELVETMLPLRSFITTYIEPSCNRICWSLADTAQHLHDVAYLAQHPLLLQIPSLSDYIDISPELCGNEGPAVVNMWIGTGGTRTPLHFDSYDNLFVQLVGVKYVRLYNQTESSKLYMSTKSYGSQGNMSDLDCEREDWTKHPEAKAAKFVETLLFPGDCLFIPARMWHYVRSLTTSASANYWF